MSQKLTGTVFVDPKTGKVARVTNHLGDTVMIATRGVGRHFIRRLDAPELVYTAPKLPKSAWVKDGRDR
jgi:hypothetical protein